MAKSALQAAEADVKNLMTAEVIDAKAAALKARRDAALKATFGLLKGKGILPEDALQFEREMREE